MSDRRIAYLDEAMRQLGKPYIWGSKGQNGTFDCSGLVTWCLKAVGGPDFRSMHNCARIWSEFPITLQPKPGDLVLYGKGSGFSAHASHVMIWVGDGRVLGACGGDSSTKTVELAAARGARVRYRAKVDYRAGFLGFRSLSPWLD